MKFYSLSNYGRKAAMVMATVVVAGGFGFYTSDAIGAHGIVSSCVSAADCPKEDVVNTKHNLAHNRDIQVTGTTEICVFCHTPHGANISMPGAAPSGTAPLWNRMLPGGTYTVYNSPNFDNPPSAGNDNQPKGVSLACLSCHDGTIAIDALVNAPGSGGYIPGNAGTGAGGTRAPGFAFNGPFVDADGTLSESTSAISLEDADGNSATTDPQRPPSPFPNLGVNLSDDHPIGIVVPSTDPQFNRILADADLDGGREGVSVWYLRGKNDAALSADKRDRVRLYPSAGDSNKYVECASCHNPHTPRPVFLRLPQLPTGGLAPANDPNSQSALCLTCHDK